MLVIDASVAVKWVLEEDGSAEAVALGRQDALAAPEFWLIEAANVLWKRSRRGEITEAEAAAVQNHATLVTADKRLLGVARQHAELAGHVQALI